MTAFARVHPSITHTPAVAMAPTAEQEAVIVAYLSGHNAVVEALAGTGKTSTLRMLASTRPGRPGAYIAYNKAIADEAGGRFPRGIITGTAHSFAYKAVGRGYAHRLPGARYGRQSTSRRLPAWEVAKMLRLRDDHISGHDLSAVALARLAEGAVKRWCMSADDEVAAKHVPHVAGVDSDAMRAELAQLVVPAAKRAWADICDPAGKLWFDHGYYLKMWQLSRPTLPVEYVMFDEAQDANPCIAAVVAAQPAQLVYVGDRNQAIMGWNGAVDAMSTFTGGVRLPLTKSWRFGQAVADEANEWLAMLASTLRVQGNEAVASSLGPVDLPDAILCRTNGGAMAEVVALQDEGKRVHLVGDGAEVKRFAFAARGLMAGTGCDMPELAAFRTWSELCEYVEDEESGKDLAVLVKLVQRFGPAKLIDAVSALVPADRAQIIVSTAHKSKGLEWGRVRIAGDFQAPAHESKVERGELMLCYVAATRAQHQLDRGGLEWRFTGEVVDGMWMSFDGGDNDEWV